MTDIVERLRASTEPVRHEAADEIERLREQLRAVLGHVEELRAEIERLKSQLAHANDPTSCGAKRGLGPILA